MAKPRNTKVFQDRDCWRRFSIARKRIHRCAREPHSRVLVAMTGPTIVVVRFDNLVRYMNETIEELLAFVPAADLRLLGGRQVTLSNDIRMALEVKFSCSPAFLGIARSEDNEIVGCGFAYANVCSVFVDPRWRRQGVGTWLVQALRNRAGDVLVGCSSSGKALQRKLDRSRSWPKRTFFYLWRRRPRISAFCDFSHWTVGFAFPSRWRIDVYFFALHIAIAFDAREGAHFGIDAEARLCDHGVALTESCVDCKAFAGKRER